MKRFVFFVVLFFSVVAFGQYQNPHINFKKTKHDFGILKEGISASVKFEFTNTGAKPLIIQDVKSSCGCTTPNWTKKPVPPGGSGYITVIYNTTNRPGKFTKTITVISNADNSPTVLTITGMVKTPQQTNNQGNNQFRYSIGELKLNKNFLNFGNIYNTEKKTLEIGIYNPTDHDLKIVSEERYRPRYIDIKIEPEVLKPKEKGKIIVTYDATRAHDWDYVRGFIYLTINGQRDYRNRIQISAVIKEYFS